VIEVRVAAGFDFNPGTANTFLNIFTTERESGFIIDIGARNADYESTESLVLIGDQRVGCLLVEVLSKYCSISPLAEGAERHIVYIAKVY